MPTRTRIKICGLTRTADVAEAVAAGADAIGFVLYPASPRAVSIEQAAGLARTLPPFVTPVLLFVNPEPAMVQAALAAVPQAMPQFHGDESPALCRAAGRPYLRAVPMAPGVDLLDWARRYGDAAALLLDTASPARGGTGKVFDWSLVPASVPLPVVLSGGLTAANVGAGMARLAPFAVDVSSGVEAAKGIKDGALMRAFCGAVRAADVTHLDTP